MPVKLEQIREQLLPGLWQVGINQRASYRWVYAVPKQFVNISRHPPVLPASAVALLGAAAVVAKNPTITRRFWKR